MRSREQNSPSKDFDLLPPLPANFFLKDTATVARRLLGKGLCVRQGRLWLVAEITETEAYLGVEDPASHAYRGRTQRNQSMFATGGTCYVYLSYGINFCMNVATRTSGVGEAVLLRSARPIAGHALMARRRSTREPHQFLSGPGKLTQALDISLAHNGMTFDGRDFKIVDLGRRLSSSSIGTSPRIGISKATDRLLRFFVQDSEWLSR